MRSLINNATIRNVLGFNQDAAIACASDKCYGMRGAHFYLHASHSGSALSAALALADGWRRTVGRLLSAIQRPATLPAAEPATASTAIAAPATRAMTSSVAMKRRLPVAVRRTRRLAVR